MTSRTASSRNSGLNTLLARLTTWPLIRVEGLYPLSEKRGAPQVTVDGELAAEVAQVFGASQVVGAHTDSWTHLTETRTQLNEAFAAAGLADRLQQD